MSDYILAVGGKDENGNAKSIEIDKGALKTKEVQKLGKEPVHHLVRQTVLEAGETKSVLTIDHPIEVQHFVWGVTHENVQIILSALSSTGVKTLVGDIMVGSNGIDSATLTPSVIVGHMVDLFNVNLYSEGRYKFSLSRPLTFPYGLQIEFMNRTSDLQDVGLRLYGVNQDV